jgi:hypothetical protein
MATYHSLTPSTRSLSYGDYPQGTYEAVSGANVRFKYGSDRVVQRLQLGYQYLTETEMQLLLDHYEGQQGTLIPFALSAEVWAGYTTPPVAAVDYEWRYASAFEVGIASPMRYNATVTLESVPI